MDDSGLKMSRRIRRTPFTEDVENHNVSGYTVVNHTLLPKSFGRTLEEDYWHLKKYVQIWDVGCQRQVQIKGQDAERFVQWLTPRNLSKAKSGKCFYSPLVTEEGKIINDPVLLKLSHEKFWLSIADSDVLLWVKGLAVGSNMNVSIKEPDVWPLAIQGPKANELMQEVFGARIGKLKFFNFDWFDFEGQKQLIARSGYSKQGGFEIYLKGFELGSKLWKKIWEVGRKYNIRAGSPNIIERIEAGLLSYGNEMTLDNDPLECGLKKYCCFSNNIDYIGKNALTAINKNGVKRLIRGVRFSGTKQKPCSTPWKVTSKITGQHIGDITSGVYSPHLKTNIGLAMIKRGFWTEKTPVLVLTENGISHYGEVCAIPFEVN